MRFVKLLPLISIQIMKHTSVLHVMTIYHRVWV